MSRAYYNEIDKYAAQWLRNLIEAGHIAPGDVDERSIEDVKPNDLTGYAQCHFFAGIGIWSHALRQAGWPDDRAVWTGSCPCQPFSAAGKQKGTADARHLWPVWFRLIRECRPGVVFGEQVSAAIRQGWLDLVSTDLEGIDYAIGSAVLGAHSVGAPHIRQRLYFVADSEGTEQPGNHTEKGRLVGYSELGDLGNPVNSGLQGHGRPVEIGGSEGRKDSERHGALSSGDDWLEHADGTWFGADRRSDAGVDTGRSSPDGGFWSACDWLPCIDGKARPVEPGTFPLVNGAPARVGRLRAYGNAIVAPAAEAFIRARLAVEQEKE